MTGNSTDFAMLVTDFLPLQRNYSKNTVLSYKDTLKLFVLFLTEAKGFRLTEFTMRSFDRQLIIEYLEWLRNRGAGISTANQRLAAIKTFAEYAGLQCIECLAPLQQVQGIKARKSAAREIIHLTVEQMSLLINRPDTINRQRHTALLGHPLVINRKNEKMSRDGVNYIIAKYVQEIRRSEPSFPDAVHAHVFRHSKAMHMLAAGINIVYIRDFLGHEDISTTMIYSRADNRLKNEAINKLAPKVTVETEFPDWTRDQELLSFLYSFK